MLKWEWNIYIYKLLHDVKKQKANCQKKSRFKEILANSKKMKENPGDSRSRKKKEIRWNRGIETLST